jgi:2-oxoglutarate ferredoxin oxidoreductase subunit alpha
MYGRNGEAPMPVISASTPSDCFKVAFEACRISIEHMTPVILLSDGYIANGSEPWKFPSPEELKTITPPFVGPKTEGEFLPYKRDENLVREWATPGNAGFEHRIGGLEKEDETGNVSYDPDNHQKMVQIREDKIKKIADFIPAQIINNGAEEGEVLILGWGSTYGVIKTAVNHCTKQGIKIGHAHLTYLNPFPKNLEEIMSRFDQVLIPEMNSGQLIKIIRDRFLVDAKGINKVKGVPFSTQEIVTAVEQNLVKV